MDPIFVNQFPRTFDVEKELYQYIHITSPSSLVCFITLALVIVVNLGVCLIFGLLYANLAVFAMAIIVLLFMVVRYYTAIQAAKKRYAEQTNNHGEITVTETITDEELISESTAREEPLEVPLSDLKKMFVTKNYYMIITAEKMIYAFKKGAFTLGSEEEFTAFMTQQIEHNKRKGK